MFSFLCHVSVCLLAPAGGSLWFLCLLWWRSFTRISSPPLLWHHPTSPPPFLFSHCSLLFGGVVKYQGSAKASQALNLWCLVFRWGSEKNSPWYWMNEALAWGLKSLNLAAFEFCFNGSASILAGRLFNSEPRSKNSSPADVSGRSRWDVVMFVMSWADLCCVLSFLL